MSFNKPSLFPSANTAQVEQVPKQSLDWLENKSFTSETAEKVVQFQHELKQLQGDDDHSDRADEGKKPGLDNTGAGTSEDLVAARILPDVDYTQKRIVDRKHDSFSEESVELSRKKRKKQKRHGSGDDSDSDTHRRKKKSKHKHKKKYTKEKHKRKDGTGIEIKGMFDSKQTFLEEIADIAPDHAFKLDKNPETNNWTYGSLYAGHVASYKPVCYQPVAAARNQIIHMKEQGKKKADRTVGDRYFSKENRKAVKKLAISVIELSKQETKKGKNMPVYISIQDQSDKNAVENMDIRQKILDDATSMYVVGKHKITDEEVIEVPQDPLQLKVADYNKRLRESSSDVKLWLEFVKFQDKLAINDRTAVEDQSADTISKKQSARAVLEKKLSILDKALQSNIGNVDLLLEKFRLSSDILDSAQIGKDIEQLLFVHVANTRLWKYYLMFNQSRLATFSVSKMTKHYHKCFKTLFAILEGRMQTHSVPEDFEREILDMFLQYCIFLKQAGYKEKAVASFQAQIEFNMFLPASLTDVSKETKMAAFEEFWDSSCPKIGNSGACGWRKWSEQGSPAADVKENSDPLEELETSIIEEELSKHESWSKIEELRDKHHWLPWQPGEGQTEEDCEDVERLVVVADVSPLLFEISKYLHFEFLLSFLKFLGIETKCGQVSGCFSESVNELTQSHQSRMNENVSGDSNEILQTFAAELLKLAIPCFKEKSSSDLTVLLIEVQLSKYQKENWSKSEKKEMKNILKQVLKDEQNRNDLAVWSVYIDLERSIGKPGEAENVMETALTMYSGGNIETTKPQTVGLVTLYCQYCEMLMKMDNKLTYKLIPRAAEVPMETKKTILSVINCLVEGRKFSAREVTSLSGVAVLKTSTNLTNICRTLCEALCNKVGITVLDVLQEHFLKMVWCCSLFAYCKSNLSSSLTVYTSMIQGLSGCDKDVLEVKRRLYLDMLKLIVYHMSVASSPLHVLREHLDTALHEFPEDDVLLSLYIDVERKARVSGRLNAKFDRLCRTLEVPTPAVFAVLFQLHYIATLKNSDESTDVSYSSIVHRSRVWLENSLSHNSLQHCPILWRLYLQVEKRAGSRERMKGVFYRAVQQCPWNKSIYMDGIRLLGGEQLQEIVDLMTEKELRVQIPVEELDILMSP